MASEDKDEEEGVNVEEKFETLVEANDTLLERVVRRCTVNLNLMEFPSLIPRPLPAFQCCTLKSERAWYLKSRA